ncbi:MAG: hypothetical protein HY934_04805, partial [Candidatus Firestonebacteria bacterium]|nr:hypothetical protein [Candidatus Firestonebacteria bacterium]
NMNITQEERKAANKIIEQIDIVLNREIKVKKDYERNIKDIIKSIDKLIKIKSSDITEVRLKLDELLKINEIKWSMWN